MNKVWQYFLLGIVVAIGGLFVTNFIASILNMIMDYGTAYVISICMYLSVVVVTCTGIIVIKLDKITHLDRESGKQSNEQSE